MPPFAGGFEHLNISLSVRADWKTLVSQSQGTPGSWSAPFTQHLANYTGESIMHGKA